MSIEDLIKILNKFLTKDEKNSTQALISTGDNECELVGYVVYNLRSRSVMFYTDKPDWSKIEKDEDIKIMVISEDDCFAKISYREL